MNITRVATAAGLGLLDRYLVTVVGGALAVVRSLGIQW